MQKKITSTRNDPSFVPEWSVQASVFVVLAEGTGMCGPSRETSRPDYNRWEF